MVNTSEGRPPQHQTQMKLFNAIAAAAVIGASFIAPNPAEASGRCPSGTSYHKIRVGGLIKRTAAEGCFTDFQASQLRMQANANQQQRIRNFQRNLNEAFRSPVNCYGTVNSWGGGYNTYNSSCY